VSRTPDTWPFRFVKTQGNLLACGSLQVLTAATAAC
jgi:hypothetical protein